MIGGDILNIIEDIVKNNGILSSTTIENYDVWFNNINNDIYYSKYSSE